MKITVQNAVFPHNGECLIYPFFSDSLPKKLSDKSLKSLCRQAPPSVAEKFDFTGSEGEVVITEAGSKYEYIVFMGLGKKDDCTPSLLKKSLIDAITTITTKKVTSCTLFVGEGIIPFDLFEIGQAIGEAAHLATYRFLKYKSDEKSQKDQTVTDLFVCIDNDKHTKNDKQTVQNGVSFGEITASGINTARDLINEPASAVFPITLLQKAKEIADKSGGTITVTVLDKQECEKRGMGAFLAVGQGSDAEPYFIIMSYKPQGLEKEEQLQHKVALVGKAITFDTGGYSLKPAEYMEDMKIDMAGAAAVLGTFTSLAQINPKTHPAVPFEVYGIMAACENMVSGNAYRPGDVLTASNGKTIEVQNTDAEGRLTLADALVYAVNEIKADTIIDLATLTGAVMVGLGDKYAALYTNHPETGDHVLRAARKTGENLWELPLYQGYMESMKSDVADLRNISTSRYGGSITAALFLQNFVDEHTKWVHIDLAGPVHNKDKPKGLFPKGGTGFGVATLVRYLIDSGALSDAPSD